MKVRVLVEMDDGGRGVRAVNAIDSAMREYNEKLTRAVPDAAIDFEVLGIVRDAEVRAQVEPTDAQAAAEADRLWPHTGNGGDLDHSRAVRRLSFRQGAEWMRAALRGAGVGGEGR